MSCRGQWHALPCDVLHTILLWTGENPLRFAGVCKGWRWVLDDARHRRFLKFSYTPTYQYTLVEAARSFSLFVCRRPAMTTSLTVHLHALTTLHAAGNCGATAVHASLAPVVVHLAPHLHQLTMEPATTADIFTNTPLASMCTRLRHVRAHINSAVGLSHLYSLRTVNLSINGPYADAVHLPTSLASCRVQIFDSAPRCVLDNVLAQVSLMRTLNTLVLHTDYTCTINLDVLPPRLQTLVLVGTAVYITLAGKQPTFPYLLVLGLTKCQVSLGNLAALLRSPSLHTLQLQDYWLDEGRPHVDMTNLSLTTLIMLTDRYRPCLTYSLPAGIVTATLGFDDIGNAMQQPAFTDFIEDLGLNVAHMTPAELDLAWPLDTQLPRLRCVSVQGCDSLTIAAMLGQRCGRATLTLDFASLHAIDR